MRPKDILCFHKWKKFEEFEIADKTCILYRCTKCGAIQKQIRPK